MPDIIKYGNAMEYIIELRKELLNLKREKLEIEGELKRQWLNT